MSSSATAAADRRTEFVSLLRLAVPVVLTQLATLLLQLVDTLVVGRFDSDQLAGLGAGMAVFHIIVVAGIGYLFSLDALVSQAHGAGDSERCRRAFWQGLWASFALAAVLTPVQLLANAFYASSRASDPQVLAVAAPFLDVLTYSYLPLLLTFAFQRYFQAIGVVAPMLWITVAGNVINYYGNVWFVFGKPEWGIASLGAVGSAWSTFVSRWAMVAACLVFAFWKDPRLLRTARRWSAAMQKEIFRLGWAAGLHFTVEVGAFAIAALIASHLGPTEMASHHVVISIASFMFMLPMGIASATSVRVGHHVGSGKPREAVQVGWFGIALAAGVMACSSVAMLSFPRFYLGLFTTEAPVLELGSKVLFLAALFQIFDGIQAAGAGALRGISDTRSPALANLIGHYPIGLALGATLCFGFDFGLTGVWTGLTTGLFSVAVMLLLVWRYRATRIVR